MGFVHHGNIYLPLLPGWTDGTQIVLLKDPVDGFRANLVISSEPIPAGETLDSFVLRIKPSLEQALEDYSLEDEGPVQYGSWIGYRLEHSFTIRDDRLKQMQFFTSYQSKWYILTFSDILRHFDQTKKEGEHIFSQLKLK